jgi:drug/metabolite transporter (DMT)-like permease
MSAPLAAAGFALFAAACWGASDFVGGYAARRIDAFLFTTIAHASGTGFMLALAFASHAPAPSFHNSSWAVAAGLSGGAALAVFYRALSFGKMGLAAPVSAVVAAAIPTLFGILTEGVPGAFKIGGFVLAAAGIWLVSRPDEQGHPREVGSAALAAIGFAGYFVFIKQAGTGSSVFWIAGIARFASFLLTLTIVLAGWRRAASIVGEGTTRVLPRQMEARAVLGILAGFMDISGSAFFIRASQIGRLDAAVVLSSLYPAVTVLLARVFLHERFSGWKTVGMLAALAAVPMIAA